MKFQVNKDKLTIENNKIKPNSGSINYYEIDCEFDESWNDLIKEAVIIKKDDKKGTSIAVINNKVFIDKDSFGFYKIGFVGYTIENEEKTYQISTNLKEIYFNKGAGEIETSNSEDVPTPSEWEVYIAQIESMVNGLEEQIPTKISQLQNDNYTVQDEYYVHTDNNFTNAEKTKLADLENYDDTEIKADILSLQTNKANVNDVYTKIETNTLLENKADVSDIPDVSSFITKDVNNLTYYTLKINTGSSILLSIDSSTYVVTLSLKNADGAVISSGTIDLPLETMVVGATYDSETKEIVLTLKNGSTVRFSVADLVSGLQSEITSENKLASDLIDDTNQTNKFVSSSEKTNWNAKYDKPNTGIPKTDLSSSVQESLNKADTAIQDVSGKEDVFNKVTTISSESTNIQYPSAKCVYDSQEQQNGEIQELYNQIPNGTATGDTIYLSDSSNLGLVNIDELGLVNIDELGLVNIDEFGDTYPKLRGKTTQKTDEITYKCIGTESGDYYLSYNNNSYYFTMPIITAGDILVFNTTSLKLYKDSTEITTTESGTGTELTFIASPNPDCPQEIKNVKGNVEVKVQNKNLFDKNNVIENELYSSDGSVINNNSYCRSSTYVNCHGFQYLTISGCGSSSNAKIILYDKDKQYVDYYSVTNRTIQIPNNIYFFRISTDKIYLNSLQVEKGSTATQYIAHQEQTALFTLEEGQYLAEGDYLADDGIHKNRKKIILDGTSGKNFSSFSTGANNRGVITALPDIKKGIDFRYNTAKCSNFSYVPNVYFDSDNVEGFIVDSTGTIYIRFGSSSEINTLTKANQWLSNNLPELEYDLAEEQVIPYTQTQPAQWNAIKALRTYKNITHINTSASINPDLDIVYKKDLETLFENLDARLTLVE